MAKFLWLFIAVSAFGQIGQPQGVNNPSASASSSPVSFDFKNGYGGKPDDSTDNCTALATMVTAVNAYAGPGVPLVTFSQGPADKAFLFNTLGCTARFTIPVTVSGGATIDIGPNVTGTLLDMGPTVANFGNAANQIQPYTVTNLSFVGGGGGAGAVKCEPFMAQCVITDNSFHNFGTSANPAMFAAGNNSIIVSRNLYWNDDTTAGRRAVRVYGNGNSSGSGEVSDNSIVNAHWNGSTYDTCGGTGVETDSYGLTIAGNSLYGFNNVIRIDYSPFGGTHIINNPNMDTNGCTNTGVNSEIQLGTASASGTVQALDISHNNWVGGTLFAKAGDTTTLTTTGITADDNQSQGNSALNGTLICINGCSAHGNIKVGGSASSCSVSTTGAFGVGATCGVLNNHCSIEGCLLVINTGSSPGASGTITVNVNQGAALAISCTGNLHNFTSNWNARASAIVSGGDGQNSVIWTLDNNAVTFSASQSNAYAFDFSCKQLI